MTWNKFASFHQSEMFNSVKRSTILRFLCDLFIERDCDHSLNSTKLHMDFQRPAFVEDNQNNTCLLGEGRVL